MATWEVKPNTLSLAIQSVIQEPVASILTGIFQRNRSFTPHQEHAESAPTFEQEPYEFVCLLKIENCCLKEFQGQDYAVFQKDTSQTHLGRGEK